MAQAEDFQLSHATLVQYERGERLPRVDLALWMADLFDEKVEDIFG